MLCRCHTEEDIDPIYMEQFLLSQSRDVGQNQQSSQFLQTQHQVIPNVLDFIHKSETFSDKILEHEEEDYETDGENSEEQGSSVQNPELENRTDFNDPPQAKSYDTSFKTESTESSTNTSEGNYTASSSAIIDMIRRIKIVIFGTHSKCNYFRRK